MNQHFQPDGRSNRERMLAGDQYIADDPDLARESSRAANLTTVFNNTTGNDYAGRDRVLRELLGSVGQGTVIRPPFRCDYGYQTHIGALDVIEERAAKGEISATVARKILDDNPRRFYGL